MAKNSHRILTTNHSIDAALRRAKAFAPADRYAVKVRYEPLGDRITLFLNDGVNVSIPRRYLQGLEHAKRSELSEIELLGHGTGVHWPQLDVDHYVPGLLNSIFGTRQWMAELGQRGGASTSEAKREAARANGAKGGRPRKQLKRGPQANGKRLGGKSSKKTA
jgi:hypothetical protein